eukprot:10653612-Prorocentrum_lima.AAC.1
MGGWGAESAKPTRLWGTPAWVKWLKASKGGPRRNHNVVTVYRDGQGQKKIVGGKGLKATQRYPAGYGKR